MNYLIFFGQQQYIMTTNTQLEKIDKVLLKISGKELKDFVRSYAFTHEDLATALVEKY